MIGDMASGTSGSMQNISKEQSATLPILVPPLPMQEKFAQVLQRVERLRTQLCRFYTYDPNLNGFRNITSRFS